jgi:hypothetical protein
MSACNKNRHALAEDLKGVVEVLLAGSLPNTDACLNNILQQLRVVVSRVQRSVDLATACSNYTVEELEAEYSLTRERYTFQSTDFSILINTLFNQGWGWQW